MEQKIILVLLKVSIVYQIGLSNAIHLSERLGTMTEIVCNADSDWDIFTCHVIENYVVDNSIYHIVVVNERFRGVPKDTIRLAVTHVGCTNGRIIKTKLIPGSEHLIFAIRQNNGLYLTRYGHAWHSGILNVRINEDYKEIEARSKKYLNCLREYFAKVQDEYTGPLELESPNYFKTTGYLKNGLPEGEWVHHNLTHDEDIDYKTTINYRKQKDNNRKIQP